MTHDDSSHTDLRDALIQMRTTYAVGGTTPGEHPPQDDAPADTQQ